MVNVKPDHNPGKGARGHRRSRRRSPVVPAPNRDDRLIWLSIAVVLGVQGGVLAGLLTAVVGGDEQAALAAGGSAALGTFGAVLAAIRFLDKHSGE
nr:hypothetical protein [uncultured Actinoplanes sp.]